MAGQTPQPRSTDPDYLAWLNQQALNNQTRRNQFAGITDYEPFDIARNNYDNPPFTWPAKQYTDITGNQVKIQRGYMRSLITDSRHTTSTTAKNRRLFFQFNPTVLVRSVQQSVGAMNPLLQDPAQLLQPVPGTATFGFELLFNREKEVASGMSYPPGEQPPQDDLMTLPNGDFALASQIGVLADILVLDTITGQGISKDMIDLASQRTQEAVRTDITTREERIKSLLEGDDNETEVAVEREDIKKLQEKVSSLSEQYNLNIGNQAFLNPLPFRVLFSSLFMIEGVATSVEVQYQKFSANMVPTQCKVIINMYALYIGFAQRDTFLTKNLESAATQAREEKAAEDSIKAQLDYGIKSIKVDKVNFKAQEDVETASVKVHKVKVEVTPSLRDKIVSKEFTDVYMKVFMNIKFYDPAFAPPTREQFDLSGQFGTGDGKKDSDFKIDIPYREKKFTPFGPDRNTAVDLSSVEVKDFLIEEANKATPRLRLAYELMFVFVADDVESTPIYLPVVMDVPWATGLVDGHDTPAQVFTNGKTSVNPAPSTGIR